MPKAMPSAQLKNLQAYLRRQGFNLGTGGPLNDGVDGDWGPQTERAFLEWLGRGQSAPAPAPASHGGLSAPGLPREYDWLLKMGSNLPLTIWEALREYGVKELAGAASSPTIMGWAAEVGLQATYTADSVPWCGLFAAVVCKRAGKEVVKDPLWALNWAKFGVEAGQPSLGDILVFVRDGGGHVGFYIGESATHYYVLGGNTSDQVMIAKIEKKRLKAARRPIYKNQPASVRPYVLSAAGPVSTNEA